MAEFDAAHQLADVKERAEQTASGQRIIPISAAVIAVCAALATLFANHNSLGALSEKNEAILYQTRASDQYAYYESTRIKIHVAQALLASGLVTKSAAVRSMQSGDAAEQRKADRIQRVARADELSAIEHQDASERLMQAYERNEVAATLFEVCIVLVSVTALMRTRVLLYVAVAGSLVGLAFLLLAFLR